MPLIRVNPGVGTIVDEKEVDYKVISLDYTIEPNDRLAVDTTAGRITLTLPAIPELGDTVAISDAGGDKTVNGILIRGNGNKLINSTYEDLNFNTNNKEIRLIWNGNFWALVD